MIVNIYDAELGLIEKRQAIRKKIDKDAQVIERQFFEEKNINNL